MSDSDDLRGSRSRELVHGAFEAAEPGSPLEQARLGDQERLGILLQGAAVIAHLEHGGWHLGSGLANGAWDEAEIDSAGVLKLPRPREGRAADLPQTFLLRLLQSLFRTDGEIPGRSPARRVARHLWGQWRQTLAPVPPDLAVRQVLDSAAVLWQPSFARARHALAAEHRDDDRRRLWIVGRGPARQRLLASAASLDELYARLGSDEALDLWEGVRDGEDPRRAFEAGRWQKAAALWRRQRRRIRKDALDHARSLLALGRSTRALEVIGQRKSPEARVLRLWCLLHQGEGHAARKALRRLEVELIEEMNGGEESARLTEGQLVQVAEIGVRLLAAHGDRDGARRWVSRALACREERPALAAQLVAAAAAWDLGEKEATGHYLGAAAAARDDPELAHRWHQVEGLRRLALDDAPGAVEHTIRALALRRRRCGRYEASRLWNDVAVARSAADDLPGAEKAIRTSVRLMMQCEGAATSTLAFHNLAHLRVRRGRFHGVEHSLSRMVAENRRADNRRGLLRDFELWCRFELALGRPRAALGKVGDARALKGEPRQAVFSIFAARAHGWLGHTDKAAAYLDEGEGALHELDPEERPALWALAGRPEEAARLASGTPYRGLWGAVLSGEAPPWDSWEAVDTLIPFRAARLIHDLELLLPGTVPPSRVRRALATFRRLGAQGFVDRLESGSSHPWRALHRFLAAEKGSAEPAELLRGAGFPEARLEFHLGEEIQVLADGEGGEERLAEPVAGGLLELRHPFTDTVLETLLRILGRSLSARGLEGKGSAGSASPSSGKPTSDEPAARLADEDGGEGAWVPSYHEGILGRSPELLEVLSRLDRLAVGRMPVLVLGESGTGKELMARRVHQKSPRSSAPFVAINCGAISESLIQSELFGHVRGAFTGADRDRQGIFESARGGTIFLDEIGDLPSSAQAKLLRVLEEGEVRRVGESLPRKVDVRIVAATHRDLEQMVADGEFRQDLLYRLKVARVMLPPLRQRGDDVLLLADFFVQRTKRQLGIDSELSAEARQALLAHGWPGNVRELKNVLEVGAALAAGEPIRPEHLDLPERALDAAREVEGSGIDGSARPASGPGGDEATADEVRIGNYHQLVLDFRRDLVRRALHGSGGNRAAAARALDMTRQNLSYLVRQLFEDDPLLEG